MENIIFLIMRRMRQPLLTLIVVYAITIIGLILIPGQDTNGEPWHMGIFHAFYFVSFMATTIGFGEIPHDFTDAQRLWVTLSMYASVVSWIYALGTILTLVQDKTFQRALTERSFAKRIASMREPFYLVCGYGETGEALVRALTSRSQHVVVLDKDEEKINFLQLQNLRDFVPAFPADARRPVHLMEAGLQHPACAGVVALTNDNEANLKIAITSKLLHPDVKVICRADSHEVEANMASFGTNYIVDPFDTFSSHLDTAFKMPCLHLLHTWLGSEDKAALAEPVYPPSEGHWIVCGYGRFGKAMASRLKGQGLSVSVIEKTPITTDEAPAGYVVGRGTEADTLLQAGLDHAVGIVAGTDDDTDNLSIVMTARDLNPEIFSILRQNCAENDSLFKAIKADMVMNPSAIIADKVRVLLGTPMLHQFIILASHKEDGWICELVSRLAALTINYVPEVHEMKLTADSSEALSQLTEQGGELLLGEAIRDPWKREDELSCIVLMIQRDQEKILLPDNDTELMLGDELLLCGKQAFIDRFHWNLRHSEALEYVRTGEVSSQSWLWRKLKRS